MPTELERLWKTVLAELELSVSKAVYQTHFAPAVLVSMKDEVITIGLPSALVRSLIESRYYSLLKSVLDHHTKSNTSLLFTISSRPSRPKDAGPLFSGLSGIQPENLSSVARRLHIGPDLTFESFGVCCKTLSIYFFKCLYPAFA